MIEQYCILKFRTVLENSYNDIITLSKTLAKIVKIAHPSISFLYLAFCLYLALDMLVHMGVRWVQERVPHADRIFRSLDAAHLEDRRNILEDAPDSAHMSYSTLAERHSDT